MKKIGTKLDIIAIKGNINYSKATIKQFTEYKKDGIKCDDVINTHNKEVRKWTEVLSEFRTDIVFVKANKVICYRKAVNA